VSTSRIVAALLLGTCLSAQARVGITRADWGITAKGEKVEIFTLTGTGGLEAGTARRAMSCWVMTTSPRTSKVACMAR
jgi:hypothetical protein